MQKERLAITLDKGPDGPEELLLQAGLALLACGNLPRLLLLDDLLVQLEEESHLVGDEVDCPPPIASGLGGKSQNEDLLQVFEHAGLLGVPEEEVCGPLIDNDVEPLAQGGKRRGALPPAV